MNAMLDLLRLRGKKGFSTTKFALLLGEILFAVFVVWFAVPFIFGFLGSAVPRLWTCVRSAAAPPYLFLAINFIILTIWKLSENRSARLPEEESNSSPSIIPLQSIDLASAHDAQFLHKSSPEDCNKAHSEPYLSPAPEPSCLAAESEQKSISSSSSPSSDGFSAPEPALAAIDPSGKDAAMVDGRNEDDSLNAAWNSIIRKTGRFPAPSAVDKATSKEPSAMPRVCNASPEYNDDINQKFDDFIKKNYDQIRVRKPGGPNQHWRIN